MADFGVIADVSETLQGAINAALATLTPAPPPQAVIHDLQGNIATNPPTLTIFLYEITEDPSTRNRARIREDLPGGSVSRKPALTLLLRYLLTPFAGDRLTEHRMLGRAMQVLYQHPIFSGPDLRGDLAPAGLVNSDDALKTTLAPLTLEERTRVWYSVQRPYHLSINYEIRVANVEPEGDLTTALIRERTFERMEREPA